MSGGDEEEVPLAGADPRDQAAAWFARMRRPDAARFKPAFEAWIAAAPDHRGAYHRVAARFDEAEILERSSLVARRRALARPGPARRAPALIACAAAALLLTIGALSLRWAPGQPAAQGAASGGAVALETARFQTARGEIRKVALVDGSAVTLDTDSVLAVVFTSGGRHLSLERGRARFFVAHEARPFVVAAGSGTVTAHGTVFDVAVDADARVRVALLRGVIDVGLPAQMSGPAMHQRVRRLRPGAEIAFDARTVIAQPPSLSTSEASWPDAMIDVEDTPLPEVLAQANRYAQVQLVLGDPGLEGLRASGRFRINDPARLADDLARTFNLDVDRTEASRLVLRRR